MNNFREVNDDILREWILFREDILSSITLISSSKKSLSISQKAQLMVLLGGHVPRLHGRNDIKRMVRRKNNLRTIFLNVSFILPK